jgi:hypothetical protein
MGVTMRRTLIFLLLASVAHSQDKQKPRKPSDCALRYYQLAISGKSIADLIGEAPTQEVSIQDNDRFRSQVAGSKNALSTSIAEIQKQFKKMGAPLETVKTIFYPLAGRESALGFLLFPQAETVVTVCDVPFRRAEPINAAVSPIEAWSHTEDVRTEENPVGALIGSIVAHIPSSRVKSVQYFETEPGDIARARAAFQGYEMDERARVLISGAGEHGVISFDTGDGTPVRKFIQLNALVHSNIPDPWWVSVLERSGFDAAIVKAAAGTFAGGNSRQTQQRLEAILRSKNGILIQGLDDFTGGPELEGVRLDGAQTAQVKMFFGYMGQAVLTHFSTPAR